MRTTTTSSRLQVDTYGVETVKNGACLLSWKGGINVPKLHQMCGKLVGHLNVELLFWDDEGDYQILNTEGIAIKQKVARRRTHVGGVCRALLLLWSYWNSEKSSLKMCTGSVH